MSVQTASVVDKLRQRQRRLVRVLLQIHATVSVQIHRLIITIVALAEMLAHQDKFALTELAQLPALLRILLVTELASIPKRIITIVALAEMLAHQDKFALTELVL